MTHYANPYVANQRPLSKRHECIMLQEIDQEWKNESNSKQKNTQQDEHQMSEPIPIQATRHPSLLLLNIAGGHEISRYTMAGTLQAVKPAIFIAIHTGLEPNGLTKDPQEDPSRLKFNDYTTLFPSVHCKGKHIPRGKTQGVAFIIRNDIYQNHQCVITTAPNEDEKDDPCICGLQATLIIKGINREPTVLVTAVYNPPVNKSNKDKLYYSLNEQITASKENHILLGDFNETEPAKFINNAYDFPINLHLHEGPNTEITATHKSNTAMQQPRWLDHVLTHEAHTAIVRQVSTCTQIHSTDHLPLLVQLDGAQLQSWVPPAEPDTIKPPQLHKMSKAQIASFKDLMIKWCSENKDIILNSILQPSEPGGKETALLQEALYVIRATTSTYQPIDPTQQHRISQVLHQLLTHVPALEQEVINYLSEIQNPCIITQRNAAQTMSASILHHSNIYAEEILLSDDHERCVDEWQRLKTVITGTIFPAIARAQEVATKRQEYSNPKRKQRAETSYTKWN